MLPEQQQRILGYFIEEAKDHLNTIEQGLLNLQSTLSDPEMVNEVFRAAHSIKGGAAMLGLSSIQHTAHRLEDCFKILKEHQIQVDQKLESLFLGVLDTLKALLENLQGPFGLSAETANTLMAEAEPVFKWLHEHLELLVEQSNKEESHRKPDPLEALPPQRPTLSQSERRQNLQAEVLGVLREMLQMFKQPATPENRQNLQECTRKLSQLGDTVNWFNWYTLCQSCGVAIVNPDNTYLTLAKIVITDIKQALELAFSGREAEIAVSQQLQALIGVEQEIELLEITLDLVDDTKAPVEALDTLGPTITTSTDEGVAQFIEDDYPELIEIEPLDTITSLSELTYQFPRREDTSIIQSNTDTRGPEVGIAELSTLADLFEGDSSAFDDTWDKEEILDIPDSNRVGLDLSTSNNEDADSEFKDLFFQEETNSDRQTKTSEEDLSFGELFDDFVEDIELPTSAKTHFNKEVNIDKTKEITDLQPEKREKIQDEVSHLLELVFDENQITLETEIVTDIELPVIQEPSFDEIFLEIDLSPIEEISRIQVEPNSIAKSEDLTLDELFALSQEDLNSVSEMTPLSDSLLEIEDNLFWEQKSEEEDKEEIDLVEEDAAKQLENYFDNDDIFGDLKQTLTPTSENLTLELDIDFLPEEQYFDLMLSEPDDDWFEDLTLTDPTNASPVIDENHTLLQKPESLELTPEFTHSPQETTQLSFAELNIDFFEMEREVEHPHELKAVDPFEPIEELEIQQESTPINEENLEVILPFQEGENAIEESELLLDIPESELFDLSKLFEGMESDATSIPTTTYESEKSAEETTELLEIQESDFSEFRYQSEEVTIIPKVTATSEKQVAAQLLETQADRLSELLAGIELEDASVANISEEIIEPSPQDTSLNDEFSELDKLLEEELAFGFSSEQKPEQEIPSPEKLSVLPSPVTPIVANELDVQFQELEAMVKGDSPKRTSVSRTPRFEQLMRVPVKHLDDLSNLVGELVVNRNTLEQDQERMRQSLDNLLHQVQQLSDVGSRMQELYERSLLEASLLASRRNNGSSHQQTDRGFTELEMDRFTPFHSLSGEMIELIVRVREAASDIDFVTEETERVARQFRQVTNQLQEGITRARMEAFSEVTTPLERAVREGAIDEGKQAHLKIEGRDTLIDKMIMGQLKDPLTHLINNAIAHGVETPKERQMVGKPPGGLITIRAFHQGNQTVISVSDDGAGINPERVKAKAIEKGKISAEQAKTMSDVDVYDLLFQPGFSTKDEANLRAGRGVGLDVVRTDISAIRGTINIDSSVGKGTTFTIRLPLTLSICKALCCVSDKARIAFPMDGVEDTLDIPAKSVQQNADGQKYIIWRDSMLPFRPLKDILTFNRLLSRGNVYGGNRDDDMISVVVVRSASTFVALQVDQVLNEQEIVIKQFEGPSPKPIGVAGATVLGDGRIMPIADVLEIIDIFQGRTSKQHGVSFREKLTTETAVKIDPTVLIVDDSITVRELLSLTFNKAGYRVEQARDGQEAWDKLRSGLPCEIVFCDIEMPRCDGLELLSRIQKDPSLKNLPIAMLTSRGADKHRQMAVQLGASGYFTKPYLEEALLEAASRMLKGEKLVNSGG